MTFAAGRHLSLFIVTCFLGTVSLRAQYGVPAPAEPLSPALTDSLSVTPVTTLDPDLLVPARPYTYDPTGSGVSSTTLTPEVTAFDFSELRAETDTGVRDSSQAGQLSPYSSASSYFRDRTQSLGGTAGRSSFSGSAEATGANANPYEPEPIGGNEAGAEPGSSWRSTWQAGPESASAMISSWRPRATSTGKWGATTTDQRANAQQGLSSSDGLFERSRATSSSNFEGSQSGSTSMGGPSGDLQISAVPLTRQYGSNNLRLEDSTASGTNSTHRTTLQKYATPGSMVGTSVAPDSAGQLFLFSPASYSGYSFGESPFRAPGFDGRDFLSPNIFDTSIAQLPQTHGRSDQERRQEQLQMFGIKNDVEMFGIKNDLADLNARYRNHSLYGRVGRQSTAGSYRNDRQHGKYRNPFLGNSSDALDNGLASKP